MRKSFRSYAEINRHRLSFVKKQKKHGPISIAGPCFRLFLYCNACQRKIFICANTNGGKRLIAVFHHKRGDLILHPAADQVAQITRASLPTKGFFRKDRRHTLLPGEVNALFVQRPHQFIEHQHSDLFVIRLCQGTEHHHFIHTSDKFRAQEITERFHDFFPGGCLNIFCKAHRTLLALAARVGGHNNHGILKIDRAALRICNPALVENLEQNVEHIRMRLFDFVE